MGKLTQDNRLCQLTTPLGKDKLVFVTMTASESLSELFEYHIECLSEEPDLDFDGAIGQQCTLTAKLFGKQREFSGILAEAQWVGSRQTYASYQIVLRPWLWLLSHTTNCRIFQNKKAPDIIKEVFKLYDFAKYELKLTEECPTLEYCVQYRESDLDFVCRLMEQHGIYYFFKHEGSEHILVLADSKSSHSPVNGLATIPYTLHTSAKPQQQIDHWVSERRFRTGKIELNDYNYLKPNAQMASDAKGSERYKNSEMEIYDYPGKFKEKSDGERYAKIQLQAAQAMDRRRYGSGHAVCLFPGGLTKLEKHPLDSQNVEYLVVRASHRLSNEVYSSGSGGAGPAYSGEYEFLPSDRPFRAPMVTPKPRINGVQTAKVVTRNDDSSEEIEVESLGEIYVRFFWDRKKMRSCRVRVAQIWSGKKWGGQVIPRVGQEVVVEFLEGDPDRPLVIGTVYNDEYKPPHDLPAEKTVSGVKSDSTKGGGGYNEWSFDDKKGSEKITIRAEKDLDLTVRDTETLTIGEAASGGDTRKTTLKNGNDNLKIDKGSQSVVAELDITLTSNNGMITLQVGPSKITLSKAGIFVNAPLINMTAQGEMSLLADGPLIVHGTPTKVL